MYDIEPAGEQVPGHLSTKAVVTVSEICSLTKYQETVELHVSTS